MVARVGDHRVAGPEDRPERAQVGLVAGGEHERRVGPQPFGELALELQVQIERAVEKSRAGDAGAVPVERVEGALLDALVAGQAEVVVRPEHDPLLALHLDHRQSGALEHAEVRKCVELARRLELGDSLVLASLGEDVDGGGHCVGTGGEAATRSGPCLSHASGVCIVTGER